MNYYNEIDPKAAAWLRELINRDLIAQGEVDERSIEDVVPSDLKGFTQCHFFAGIGGWSYALRLAGWPDDKPVWTGSCPCQPFSTAGKGAGFDDERHLWPAWFHLIKQCGPPVIFGEQVASKAVDTWIDLVHADLESMGYAFGSVPFSSASIGAPHIRDRNYWMGVADSEGLQRYGRSVEINDSERREGEERHGAEAIILGGVADSNSDRCEQGNPIRSIREEYDSQYGGNASSERPGPVNGPWRDADWLGCRDGKWRPVEPGTFPLAHGVPARVVRLRGYGNAINPYAAKAFIEAFGVT